MRGGHPRRPLVACGDDGGGVYLLDLIGIEYGPIIVTAANNGEGLAVSCPSCRRHHPVTPGDLATELKCPTPGCGLHLRLNPLTISAASRKPAAELEDRHGIEKRRWWRRGGEGRGGQ